MPPVPPPTTSVTGTFCGLFAATLEVIVIEPLYVPAASPEAFTATLSDPGVEPLAGVTVSHDPPDAAAVKFSAVPVLDTDSVCEPDAVVPDW